MKIGIVTYHRAHNYGALLQAAATRVALHYMGYEAYFIDYWPEYHSKMYKVFSRDTIKSYNLRGKLCYVLNQLKNYHRIRRRQTVFEKFIKDYIQIYCRPVSDHFDAIIYGSDQIWRKQKGLGNTYNPVYFGKNSFHSPVHISYAASMGLMPNSESDKEQLQTLLASFGAISVREDDLFELVESIGFHAEKHIDPTLLLSAKQWNYVFPINLESKKPYVLFYDLNKNSFDLEEIKKFAKSRGLELKTIVGSVTSRTRKNTYPYASPVEFVDLIRSAEFVFTSSFHGMAFSIIYNKQFFTAFPKNSNRAATLLKLLGISERLLVPMSTIPSIDEINYARVNAAVCGLNKIAKEYLNKHLRYK